MSYSFNVGDRVHCHRTGLNAFVQDICRMLGSNRVQVVVYNEDGYHVCDADDLSLLTQMGTASTVEPMKPDVQDPINHPTHYTSHPSGVECITITEHMSFLLGNAMKYIWRADLKGGVEDLKKAVWYVEREIAKRLSTKETP